MALAGYNPYDPNQQRLLGALSLSEGGKTPYIGTGGADLSDAPRDEYGFPQWGGNGGSHAAGLFQFQPGTWDPIAARYGLDFSKPEDQKAAAWLHAQDTYAQETGGDLSAALSAGDYGSIETALGKSQWIGARGKLAGYLAGGKGSVPDGTTPISADTIGGMVSGVVTAAVDALNPFKSSGGFVRWGLLFIGVVVMLIAIWRLLSDAGAVPSAGQVVSTAAKAAVLV